MESSGCILEVPPAVDDTVIFGGSASRAGGMVGANVEDHNNMGGGGWDVLILR